ncbi:hypothetical protein [Enterobacter phage 01_vB_Eclo_IJM]|nr:hypothetical protein [Enterobacter phage 01_vB_Eclo_IJM]
MNSRSKLRIKPTLKLSVKPTPALALSRLKRLVINVEPSVKVTSRNAAVCTVMSRWRVSQTP